MKFSATIVTLLVTSACAKSVRRRLQATYAPGDFSAGTVVEDAERGTKMYLSNGLMARPIAWSGEPVVDAAGTELAAAYHESTDGGAIIPKGDGGYYYVSNSEQGEYPEGFDIEQDDTLPTYRTGFPADLTGGAYSLEFDANHELVGYKQILSNTAGNCAGGVTPWGTWISCEERAGFGRCWQADPAGVIEAKPTDVTGPRGIEDFGKWEAFAWDDNMKHGYTTNDEKQETPEDPDYKAAIVRFTPDKAAMACLDAATDEGKWSALESGSVAYLHLSECEEGKFSWVADLESANGVMYQGSEGVAIVDDILTFVTIVDKQIFSLNLTDHTYTKTPVPFPQEPDNIFAHEGTIYICTDGDDEPNDGVWGVDSNGAYNVFYEEGLSYPAGVAISPDGMRMFVSMWGQSTWQIWREDGMAFGDETATPVYVSK